MFLLPGTDNLSYATASARQCKGRSLFTAMLEQTSNVLSPAMSADCLATCDGRPVVSRTRGAGRQSHPALRSQPVFRRAHHGAGEPAAACHFACPSVCDVNRLSSDISGAPPPAVDRSFALGDGAWYLGLAGDCLSPLPLRTPAGDPTLIAPVIGTYSGEIQSLDRYPGIATRPGNAISGN